VQLGVVWVYGAGGCSARLNDGSVEEGGAEVVVHDMVRDLRRYQCWSSNTF
jgi:hypothetical protein